MKRWLHRVALGVPISIAAALAAGGCGECTNIGCDSQLLLIVQDSEGPSQNYEAVVVSGQRTVEIVCYQGQLDSYVINGESLGTRYRDCGDLHVLAPGESEGALDDTVSISVFSLTGTLVVEQESPLEFASARPNGECGPTCRNAEVLVTVPEGSLPNPRD